MSLRMRKPTIWVLTRSVTLTQTRLYSHKRWLEAGNCGFRKSRNCTIDVAKSKALISFAVTAKLICAFVFTYADSWFLPMQWLKCKHKTVNIDMLLCSQGGHKENSVNKKYLQKV